MKNCGITNISPILTSSNLRNLEVLILSKNQIANIETFQDVKFSKAQTQREVMQLQILDIRENQLSHYKHIANNRLLKNTTVFAWDNPFRGIASKLAEGSLSSLVIVMPTEE
jgi:Leucine-rich repeat (LRR) protein